MENLRSLYESVYAPKVETILEDFTDEDLDLTDQEIEEQVEEVFLECIEEGYDIDEIERAICEAVDAELQVLNEVTSPAKVAALRMQRIRHLQLLQEKVVVMLVLRQEQN